MSNAKWAVPVDNVSSRAAQEPASSDSLLRGNVDEDFQLDEDFGEETSATGDMCSGSAGRDCCDLCEDGSACAA
jgi:hypothetical protein